MPRTPEGVFIRLAGGVQSGDAEAIAAIHLRSWRAAYRAFMPAAYLDSPHHEAAARADWPCRLAVAGSSTWLALLEGAPVGFARTQAAAPEGDEPVPIGLVHLSHIHLAPEVVGTGVGTALFRHALAEAAHEASEGALWVYEANARARAFYEAMGWVPDGATLDRSFAWEGPTFSRRMLRYRGATRGL